MDYHYLSVVGSLIGTASIVLVYIYLYVLYRERYISIWAAAWLILFSRYILFDSELISWKQTSLGMTIYQMILIASILMFIWGTYIFINKPLNKWWIYSSISLLIVSIPLNLICSSIIYKMLLPIYFSSFVCIWIGLTFIRKINLQGIGHLITGYAYIIWSILNLTMPFTINIPWFAPLGYSIGGVLRLIIALGTLIVYFEKTRIELVHKEKQYRLLAENAVDIIYYYQLVPEKKIKYISPSVFSITEYTPNDFYANNKLFLNLIHPDDYLILENFINNLPDSIGIPLTLRIAQKNKTNLWIEQKCVPIYNDKGQLIALEGIIRDITERKSLEQMASLFDRMNIVGSMAASVAHEIRNPMTTVRGYLQVMSRKKSYQTDKEKFKLMIEEIDRANSIIKEYLSLSREKLVTFKKCSLNNIIEALFPLIQADAISFTVSVKLSLTDIPELLLDENEIRQLLLNLTRNSIEAMPLGGNLLISTFLEEDKIVLSINDQGSGIPTHILDHLGTPFITTKDTGTGLGLPICYQIAHRHHAKIKIDTNSAGTTFFIYFNL